MLIINLLGDLCLFTLQSKSYERISIKFGLDVQFTTIKALTRAFFDISDRKICMKFFLKICDQILKIAFAFNVITPVLFERSSRGKGNITHQNRFINT